MQQFILIFQKYRYKLHESQKINQNLTKILADQDKHYNLKYIYELMCSRL